MQPLPLCHWKAMKFSAKYICTFSDFHTWNLLPNFGSFPSQKSGENSQKYDPKFPIIFQKKKKVVIFDFFSDLIPEIDVLSVENLHYIIRISGSVNLDDSSVWNNGRIRCIQAFEQHWLFLTMSQREVLCTQKLHPKDAKGLIKIKDAFKKVSADNNPTAQPSTSSQSESLSHESQATDNINKNVNPIDETRCRSHTGSGQLAPKTTRPRCNERQL